VSAPRMELICWWVGEKQTLLSKRLTPLGGGLRLEVFQQPARGKNVHLTVRAELVEACWHCYNPSTSSGRTDWGD
jgi:hypothetical protein